MTQQSKVLGSSRRPVFAVLATLFLIVAVAACSPAAQPTTAPAAAQPAPAQTGAVSFAKDVQPVLAQRCVACHGKSGGLALSSYADLMKGGKDGAVVVPGDAANSSLVQVIASGRMPQGGAKLSQSTIDMISAWVSAGAKDN